MKMIKGVEGKKNAQHTGSLLLILFFFSGVCGLLYAIAWTQILRHSLGPPILSMIGILGILLGGLAIGSSIAGRYIDARTDPLKIYGYLEGALGIYSLFLPLLIRGMTPIYAPIYQNIRFPFYASYLLGYLLYTPILLIPSALIGATWPVMSRLLVRKMDHLGWQMGKIFGVNTLGGAFGVLAARFILLPHLGAIITIYLAAAIDLLICLCIFIMHKRHGSWRMRPEGSLINRSFEGSPQRENGRYRDFGWVLLTGYGLSCLTAVIYLVIRLRALVIFLGSSFFALSLILSAFMMGLALGSLGLAKLIDQRKDPISLLGAMEMVIGLSFLGIIPVLDRFPLFMAYITKSFAHAIWFIQLLESFLLFFMMMIPLLLLGFSFPLVCRIYSDRIESIGRSISAIFTLQALAGLLGILLGGILIFGWLGVTNGSLVAVWYHIFIGCLFLCLGFSLPGIKKTALSLVTVGSFIVFSFFIPLWEMPFFKGEPYRQNDRILISFYHKDAGREGAQKKKRETIFSRNGIIANVAVERDKEGISLLVNGVTECSSTLDLSSQILSAHIPLLLHSEPKEILLIGLGSGITLGSIEQHPIREIDCVEISQAMIEGTAYFHQFNHNASKYPRVNILIGDGRHHLMFTDKKYDVIISQPFSAQPEAADVFFTKEYLQLCRKRLRSGGIAAIKLQVKNMKPDTFQAIIYTWHQGFPFVQLWETDLGTDYLLIGSDQEIVWDYPLNTDRSGKEGIASDLGRLNIKDPTHDLLSFYFMDKKGMASYAHGSEVITDRLQQTRFLPLNYADKETRATLLEGMQSYRGKGLQNIISEFDRIETDKSQIIKERLEDAIAAKRYLTKAYIDLINNEPRERVLTGLREALHLNPDDKKALELYTDILFSIATEYINQKQFNPALWTINEIIRVMPKSLKARHLLGKIYYNMNLLDQAVEEFENLVKYQPDDEEIRCHLGMAYLNKGWIDLSICQFNHAINIEPDYAEAHLYLGAAYFKKDMIDQAIEEYKHAIAIRDEYADAHYNMGIAYLKQGLIDEAISEWKEVIRIRPNDVNSRYNLAMAFFNHGEIEQTIILLEEILSIKPDFTQARSILQMLYGMRQ